MTDADKAKGITSALEFEPPAGDCRASFVATGAGERLTVIVLDDIEHSCYSIDFKHGVNYTQEERALVARLLELLPSDLNGSFQPKRHYQQRLQELYATSPVR